MGHRPRQKPERLAVKLLAVREHLKLTQPQIGKLLAVSNQRVSEFEANKREPNLLTLLRYSHLVHLPSVDFLIDDEIDMETFKDHLAKSATN